MSTDPTFGAYEELRDEVRALLPLLSQMDPGAWPRSHPEWPLKITGDVRARRELSERIDRLRRLTQ